MLPYSDADMIYVGKDWWESKFVMIETQDIPDMYPEFAPGPPADAPYHVQAFWDTAVSAYLIDVTGTNPTITKLTGSEMRKYYKFVKTGRRNRMYYWTVMKHLESMEKEAAQCS